MVEDVSKGSGKEEELNSAVRDGEDIIPIKAPLKVIGHHTINKKFGWWAAVVLLESYAKKQICFYLWQKKDDIWKRKQKFGIHSQEDWQMMKEAVETYISELT